MKKEHIGKVLYLSCADVSSLNTENCKLRFWRVASISCDIETGHCLVEWAVTSPPQSTSEEIFATGQTEKEHSLIILIHSLSTLLFLFHKVQMPSMMYCDYYYVYVLLSGAEKAGSLRCFPVVSQLWQRFKIFIKPSFTIMVWFLTGGERGVLNRKLSHT